MVGKAQQASSSESEDWGDESWIVDCPCGVNYDDGEMMVECEECGVWVHTACCHLMKDQQTFNCDKCKSKKRKEVEESEVAQLLVDFPTKTLSFEDKEKEKEKAHADAQAAAVAVDQRERAHVQGIPGGDPRMFVPGSIFSQQLWKCAGYVRKPLRMEVKEVRGGGESMEVVEAAAAAAAPDLALLLLLESAREGYVKDAVKERKGEGRKGHGGSKHNKPKLKQKHKSPRLEKRGRDDEQSSRKKGKWSGGEAAAAAEEERSKKVEGQRPDSKVCRECEDGCEALLLESPDGVECVKVLKSNANRDSAANSHSDDLSHAFHLDPRPERKQSCFGDGPPASGGSSDGKLVMDLSSCNDQPVSTGGDSSGGIKNYGWLGASAESRIAGGSSPAAEQETNGREELNEVKTVLKLHSAVAASVAYPGEKVNGPSCGLVTSECHRPGSPVLSDIVLSSSPSHRHGSSQASGMAGAPRIVIAEALAPLSGTKPGGSISVETYPKANAQSKALMNLATSKAENVLESSPLGRKVDDERPPLNFDAGSSDGDGPPPVSSSVSNLSSGGPALAGDSSEKKYMERNEALQRNLGEQVSTAATSALHVPAVGQAPNSQPGALNSELASPRRLDAACDVKLLEVSPSSSADGRLVRVPGQTSTAMREKIYGERACTNRISSGALLQEQRPAVQSDSKECIMEASTSSAKQQLSSSHHQVSGGKHVFTPKLQQKQQALVLETQASAPMLTGETDQGRVQRQLRNCDQLETAADSFPSLSQQKHSEQLLQTDVTDQKSSPLESVSCQQARQHHPHMNRGRPGVTSSADRASSAGSTQPTGPGAVIRTSGSTPAPSKLGTSVGLKSAGTIPTSSPKSPPVPAQFSKSPQVASKPNSSSPPPQRPSPVIKTSATSSSAKQASSASKPSSLVSSSSVPCKLSSAKQSSRSNSLPSSRSVENSLPPKSPTPGRAGGLSSAGLFGKQSSHSSKVTSSGKHSGTPRNSTVSKGSHSQSSPKQPSSQFSGRHHAGLQSSSSFPAKHPGSVSAKQGTGGTFHKEEKPVTPSGPPKGTSTMPPPPPVSRRSPPSVVAGPAVTLKDEELAMLLHQELNSSPRVSRVVRIRQAISGMQAGSTGLPSAILSKRMMNGQNSTQSGEREVVPRKRLREERLREAGRSSTSVSEDSSKTGVAARKHEDGSRLDDGYHDRAGGHFEIGNPKERLSNTENGSRRSSHGFPKGSLSIVVPASNEDTQDLGERKSPGEGAILTLPGLIDEILGNRGHQLSYEDICEAVEPYWQKLRKPNGDRYAYASHRQAVLDCLRNRSAWSHLVDRGPKTNLGRKRRRADVAVTTESDEDDDVDASTPVDMEGSEIVKTGRRMKDAEAEKSHPEPAERQKSSEIPLREDVPKGKRKARSRRRRPLATEDLETDHKSSSSARADVGDEGKKGQKAMGTGQEEEPEAPSSPSSEDAVSNYSEEDEEMFVHKGMRNRRRRDGESSCGEDDLE